MTQEITGKERTKVMRRSGLTGYGRPVTSILRVDSSEELLYEFLLEMAQAQRVHPYAMGSGNRIFIDGTRTLNYKSGKGTSAQWNTTKILISPACYQDAGLQFGQSLSSEDKLCLDYQTIEGKLSISKNYFGDLVFERETNKSEYLKIVLPESAKMYLIEAVKPDPIHNYEWRLANNMM